MTNTITFRPGPLRKLIKKVCEKRKIDTSKYLRELVAKDNNVPVPILNGNLKSLRPFKKKEARKGT